MLEKVRKPGRAKSIYQIVGYTLLGLICISFAFIGLNTPSGSVEGGGVAAVVNSEIIPMREFRRALEAEQRQFGDAWNSFPAAQRRMFERRMRERTLDSLIATEVLYQSASRHGFYTPDPAVRDQVVSTSFFQEDGRFSKEAYMRLLEANAWTPKTYEATVRRQVTLGEVRDSFIRSLRKPDLLAELESQARETKLNLEFVRFDRADLAAETLVDNDKVLSYVASDEGLKAVQDHYNSQKENYRVPKEVKARHILIKAGGDNRDFPEALAMIKKIKEKATVENFGELAKAESEDLGSKDKGGDLGFFGKGRMVPEFENTAMSLAKGIISEPVQSSFGYHLILVEDERGGNLKELDEVKLEIAREVLATKVRDQALAELEVAVTEGKELDSLLRKFKLKWEETGEFNLSQANPPKLENAGEVVTEALKLEKGQNLVGKLIRADGRIHIVRVKKLTPGQSKKETDRSEFAMEAIEALNLWTQALQEETKVKRNLSLLEI